LISGDGQEYRDICLQIGVDKKLHGLVMDRLDELPYEFRERISWSLLNLCRYAPEELKEDVVERLYAALFKLFVSSTGREILKNSIYALDYLFENEYTRHLMDSKVILF
jgi:hypothetical protein